MKFNFEELKVYQKALDYVDFVYIICDTFPKAEQYCLTSQYIRAAHSIVLNIGEGAGDANAQFNSYLQIAQDAIKERVVCATIAMRQKFILFEDDDKTRIMLSEIA